MPTTQYEVVDGLVVDKSGRSRLAKWLHNNRKRLTGVIVRAKPALTPRQRIVKYAYRGWKRRASIHYSEAADRGSWSTGAGTLNVQGGAGGVAANLPIVVTIEVA